MRSCAGSTGPGPCLPSTRHQMRWVPTQALKPIPVQLKCYPTDLYWVPTAYPVFLFNGFYWMPQYIPLYLFNEFLLYTYCIGHS